MKDKLRELADEMEACWICASNGDGEITLETINNWSGRLSAILDAEGDGGVVEVSQEDRFEQFVAAEIARSPEPLRELGEYLTRVLDEDQWPTADRLLLQLATTTNPARSGVVSDEDIHLLLRSQKPFGELHPSDYERMRAALEHFAAIAQEKQS